MAGDSIRRIIHRPQLRDAQSFHYLLSTCRRVDITVSREMKV